MSKVWFRYTRHNLGRLELVSAVGEVLILCVVLVVVVYAAGFSASFEPESAALSNGASAGVRTGASSGRYLVFGSGLGIIPVATPVPVTPTPPSTVKNCAALPSACGYPDGTNTGVKSGIVLRNVPGDISSGPGWSYNSNSGITVTGNGTILENIVTNSGIDIQANNVTVRNVRVAQSGESNGIGLRHANNATISDCEIGSPVGSMRLLVGIKDVYGDVTGTQILRNEITRTSTGVQVYEGLVRDNYIHDMALIAGDHVNGTTSNGSVLPMTIQHNTIFNAISQTDAVSLFQDFGTEENRLIDNNLLAGGGYTIYGGANPGKAPTSNIVITNNRISRLYFPNGGFYGPVAAFNVAGINNVWAGNVWDDTNLEVSL